jgi:hypothetical protein
LKGLDRLLEEFFPPHRVVYFDLLTGEKEPQQDYVKPLDPSVVEWISGAPDRWLGIANKGDRENPRFVGARAFRVA